MAQETLLPHTVSEHNGIKPPDRDAEQPIQGELFADTPGRVTRSDQVSRTIDLYSAIPRFVWYNSQLPETAPVEAQFLERDFVHLGKDYRLTLHAATLKRYPDKSGDIDDEDGVVSHLDADDAGAWKPVRKFPSRREEIIEQCLYYKAAQGRLYYANDAPYLTFSLSEIRSTLRDFNHSFNLNQIREALLVCRRTQIEINEKSDLRNPIYDTNMFVELSLATAKDYARSKERALCHVRFNRLVDASIRALKSRVYDYSLAMQMRSGLGTWLFMRMIHNFSGGTADAPYSLSLKSIFRDRGLTHRKDMHGDKTVIIKALEDLKVHDIVADYEIIPIIDPNDRRKTRDIVFDIYATQNTIDQIRRANRIQTDEKKAVDGHKAKQDFHKLANSLRKNR